jgi:hypothetical protein
MTGLVLRAGAWPAVAGISGLAVVVGGCGAAFPAAATVLLPICFVLLAAAAAFTLDEPASLVVDVTPTGPVRRTGIRAVALLAPLAAGALVLLAAALRGQALPWAAAGLALAGNVLLGFAVACVVRTRTGEPGPAAGTGVVLVLMAPSLVPQVARWVRTFPAPGAGGPSSDTVWWTVLVVCVVAIAVSVSGRHLPPWMTRVPYRRLYPGRGRDHDFRPGRDRPAASMKLTDAPARRTRPADGRAGCVGEHPIPLAVRRIYRRPMSEGLSPSQSRYLAEWYQPALSEELLEETARQLDRCTAGVSAEGTAVALHLMLFMPDDEVAFCLFAAGSRAVEETCRRAGVPYERITRAISRPGAQATDGRRLPHLAQPPARPLGICPQRGGHDEIEARGRCRHRAGHGRAHHRAAPRRTPRVPVGAAGLPAGRGGPDLPGRPGCVPSPGPGPGRRGR